MKPLLHKPSSNNNISSLIFCVTLMMVFSINIQTCVCDDDDDQYTNCNNGFSCEGSSISEHLKYPFWGRGNREPYCGVSNSPDMELTCEDKYPKITISEVKYRILDWENTTQLLTVARDDYWGGDICAVTGNYKNSTFENTPFQPAGDQSGSLKLLYNCSATQPDQFYSISCGGDTTVVYTAADLSRTPCSTSVTVVTIPLLGGYLASQIRTANNLTNALEDGFELRYTGADSAECPGCVASGGVCGNNGGTGFRCFCKDAAYTNACNSQNAPSSSKSSSKVGIAIGAVAAVAVLVGLLAFGCFVVRRRRCLGVFRKTRTLLDDNVQEFIKAYKLSMPKQYSYAEVKRITNSFRDKLGQGGYGVVYKANLSDGRQVAVKLINESKGDGEEFINEVASISRTSHVNIVSLLGFCYEKNKRALIYEFLINGSLDKFIYKEGFPSAISDLDWNTMYQIAVGIARGLEYLHQGCNSRILHLDIKPQNILLDGDFCPKISDFGLAKICQKKESIVSILGTRGTIGFIAPEVFSRTYGGVSHKSDVYSYGMLILEMVGGRKNYDIGGSHTSEMYFPDWIYKDLELSESDNLKNDLTTSKEEKDMIRKITMVSLWCIQMNPSDRPSMSKVIEMLQGPLQSVPYPTRPVLFSPKRASLQSSHMSSNSLLESSSITIQEDVQENQMSSIKTMGNVTVM